MQYHPRVFALVIVGLAAAGNGLALESRLTTLDLRQCRELTGPPGLSIDRQHECPGPAGYRLIVDDADERMSLIVVEPDGRRTPLRFRELISSFFSELGERAEWRVHRTGKSIVPTALIVQFNASGYLTEDGIPTEEDISYLTVSRLRPGDICLTHVLPTSEPGAEELARRLADQSSDSPCYPVAPERMAELMADEAREGAPPPLSQPSPLEVESSRLTAEEEEMLLRIHQADPSLRYSRDVLRYFRTDPDTSARIPFLVESSFTPVDGLVLGEYISYSVTFKPDSSVVSYTFNAGHAWYGEITAVVTDRVRLIRHECGTDGCSTAYSESR